MAKVLGVVGSPRRNGNTHIMVDAILAAAREAGAETSTIFLGDLMPYECNGCHACWRGEMCSKRDGMNLVFPQVADSSAIVFGTPVYWYGPSGLMKMFMDRFVYFNCPEHRAKIRGHAAALAVPFEEPDPAAAELLVEMFTRCFRYLELDLVGKVLAPGLLEKGDVRRHADVMAACRELGTRLAGE